MDINVSLGTPKAEEATAPVSPATAQPSTAIPQTQVVQLTPPPAPAPKEHVKVIHEKPVTEVHNEFPESRSLTDKECEMKLALEKMRAERDRRTPEECKMEIELQKMRYEQERLRWEADRKSEAQLAQEARDRKGKRILGYVKTGVVAVLGIGLIALGFKKAPELSGTVAKTATKCLTSGSNEGAKK